MQLQRGNGDHKVGCKCSMIDGPKVFWKISNVGIIQSERCPMAWRLWPKKNAMKETAWKI